MAIDLDLEAPVEEGGTRLPIGKRRFVLNDAYETDRNGKRVQVLEFIVSDGQEFAGRKLKVSLYTEGKDAEATKVCANNVKRYARVLGILEKYSKPNDKAEYYRFAQGHTEIEFGNVLGAECVLDLIHREAKDSEGRVTGEVFVEPKMFGVYTIEEAAAEDAKKAAKGASQRHTPLPHTGQHGGNAQASAPAPRQLVTDDL